MTVPTEPQRAGKLVYAIPLGVMTVASLVGSTVLFPYLLVNAPLVLIALSPLFRHLVLVAPQVDAASLFAVAVPRHFLPDPFVYMLGREYGPLAVEWAEANSPFVGKMVRVLEKLFAKVGPLALLVSPDIIVSTLAGAARVPFPLFVAMNVAGTFATVVVARWFGGLFEGVIRSVTAFFQGHIVLVTLVAIGLAALFNWSSQRAAAEAEPPSK